MQAVLLLCALSLVVPARSKANPARPQPVRAPTPKITTGRPSAFTTESWPPLPTPVETETLTSTGSPPPPYWSDPRIHNLGNAGILGGLHAAVAPLFTHLIDRVAYKGVDARAQIHKTIAPDLRVVDLCCGTAFSATKGATGVDTSAQMLAMARLHRPDAIFVQGNAETWGEDAAFDVATVMYGMHEMPRGARRKVLHNAMRIARKYVLIVDIDPSFCPSAMMLSGEPFIEEYLRNIDEDVQEAAAHRAWRKARIEVVPGHVVMWRLDL
ncbi:hypothetical protein KFE25_003447 [Diacronema lutheri]|uniref:Methyltransferase domain-containing protein n=1 Tax=Diacronema lutheri TaxID=2081491 RepID=A0A8J5XI28_DIALT|nr:hypothetical protein KFE25_003447 [Diacronema lutheri]